MKTPSRSTSLASTPTHQASSDPASRDPERATRPHPVVQRERGAHCYRRRDARRPLLRTTPSPRRLLTPCVQAHIVHYEKLASAMALLRSKQANQQQADHHPGGPSGVGSETVSAFTSLLPREAYSV
ncbi:MAG: hypothetical protein M1829_000655 [Trizodia sp. TS-e1964]|nr:MAG: hypothetical protein M1829_000655 [Trizodia sp. TS-e1964]